MNLRRQFLYDPTIEVSASQIGVSKWNWICIESKDESIALEIMKMNRYDVLPIKNAEGSFDSFFATPGWNDYSKLQLLSIDESNKIYYRMSLKDLVRKFKNDENHFYFLTDYDQVIGLVSFVNLNCQLVYNYLYIVIADIEKISVDLLKKCVDQDSILNVLRASSDSHQKKLVAEFEKAEKLNIDNDIFQHLYLQSIGILLKKFELEIPSHYQEIVNFIPKYLPDGSFGKLRNRIMHPVKPILSDKNSIHQIDELLTDYLELKEILE